MSAIVIGAVAVAAIVIAYFERKSIKTDAQKVVAAAETKVANFETALRVKESQVRGKILADANKIVSDIKAWATKEAAKPEEVIAQFEARLKQIL